MTTIKIPGTTFNRDMRSRGLIETDRKKAEEYLVKKRMLDKTTAAENEINNLKTEMSSIKSDLGEIKELLKGMLK